ncbi:MAG TPA: hypothetical protein VJ746_18845 [Nitrospira sp.]|nr:hypothetical protein [Nitrospira sp.]
MKDHGIGAVVAFTGYCLCMLILSVNVRAAAPEAYGTIPIEPKFQASLTGQGQRVMGGCVESIRRSSPESHLDVYVENQSIRYIGTDEERFQLEKCMAQYGFPIVSMHRPGLPQSE